MALSSHFQILCCPKCQSGLNLEDDRMCCPDCSEKYEIIENDILSIIPDKTKDLEISIDKWDEMYRNQLASGEYYKNFEQYKNDFFEDVFGQLKREKEINKETVYLEIGCGPFFLGQLMADRVGLIIGIDFCPSALKIAKKMLDEKGIENYLLIHGDILKLPFRKESVDLIYGGGVIEHFENTQQCVEELFRVLKKDGVSFNTVPYFNLGALTYRQLWGNIPNVPILKKLAEIIHIKIFNKRFMKFGYEMSFTAGKLNDVHEKSGFSRVIVDKFQVKLSFDMLPRFMRKPFVWLADNSWLFWPMVKVIGKK